MFLRILVASFFVTCATAVPASGGPITWEYQGNAFNTGIDEFSDGTLVRLFWTFNPDEPNLCAGTNQGLYSNQGVRVEIASLTYQASGFLLAGGRITSGCAGPQLADMELRLPSWSGPDLPGKTLDVTGGGFPAGGLFWFGSYPGGAFPTDQPDALLLQGPYFCCYPVDIGGGDVIQRPRGVNVRLTAVPEPASGLLFASMGLAVWLHRRRARAARSR